jgi:septal ring factor EnvC (AmiA/AmiB activator)
MKNLVKVLAFVSATAIITACSSDAKNRTQMNLKAYNDSVKAAHDSIRLDSFQRAETIKKERAEEVRNQSSREEKSTTTTTYVQSPAAPEKKGMSSAAKGAIIGAGAGAVTGVLVDKKDGRGAIIGGVVGAGTGYVIGRSKDKKSGRVQQ